MKKIYISLIILLILSISSFAVETQDNPHFKKFDVTPVDYQAAVITDYDMIHTTWKWKVRKTIEGKLEVKVPESFGLETVTDIQVSFSDTTWDYRVSSFEISADKLWIYFAKGKYGQSNQSDGEEGPDDGNWDDWWKKFQITVTIHIQGIQNPTEGGLYSFLLTGFDKHDNVKLGPVQSNSFLIEETPVDSIAVSPSDDLILNAGDSVIYSAQAFDRFGNEVEGIEFEYSLTDCAVCVGEFVDSVLYVTSTGQSRVQVSGGGLTVTAGLVTVNPGTLSRLELQIDETQIVGHMFSGDPTLTLYDENENLVTNHDLSLDPILLFSSDGVLIPEAIDDNALLNSGVIHLDDLNLSYFGQSGEIHIYAESRTVHSNILAVSLNAYDIIDVIDSLGSTISTVTAQEATSVSVLVVNNGNLVTDSMLTLNAYFASDPSNATLISYDMSSSQTGIVDSLMLVLPVHPQGLSADELIVTATSHFTIDGNLYTVVDTFKTDITVLGDIDISYAQGSFKPDTVFANANISLSFDINISGVIPEIDTSFVTIELLKQNDTAVLSELYNNFLSPTEVTSDQIRYTNLSSRINSTEPYDNGYYPVRMSYYFISNNNIISFTDVIIDSMYVFFENGLSLVRGSLHPQIVYAGNNVSFEFKVNLESMISYNYYEATSTFRIYDANYSTSTNLFLETDQLNPGENMLRSASISIQPDQLGSELLAEASFSFSIPGTNDTLEFTTSFSDSSLPILVYSAPTVQIIDLEINAPNSPKVNTNQQITMSALIANVSEQPVTDLDVQLVSVEDASTIENPQQTIALIQPNDTVEVVFNVTASSIANLLPESFRIDILSYDVTELPPLNNSAFLFIELPAMLELSYRVNGISNVEEVIVNHSDVINLSFRVLNVGTADATGGGYALNVTGLPGGNVHYEGSLIVDSLLDFSIKAPSIDTVILFNFMITELPIDANSGSPAGIDKDSVQFRVAVLSDETELTVESHVVNSNLVNPDVQKRFVNLTFRNTGTTILNDIKLNKIEFSLFDNNYSEIDIRSVLNIGRSGFYDGDTKLTNATTGGNKVTFWFEEFIIPEQQNRTISLMLEFRQSSVTSVIIETFVNQIDAVYNSGSNTGLPVSVRTVSGSEEVISLQIVIKGSTLDESFIISDNPFNPEVKPALFSYQLPEESNIEFRVFTLTGEEVYARIIPAGQVGAQSGDNMLEWDGKNNSGHMVLNGVYIVSILNEKTGEYSRKKIALVK